MARLLNLCATAGLALPVGVGAQGPQAQIELWRLSGRPPPTLEVDSETSAAALPDLQRAETEDDAFGAQVILKRQDTPKRFSMFVESSGSFTNNVALVHRDRQRDRFVVASSGAAFTERFGYHLRFDANVRASLYRYDKFRELDFQSVDASGGLTWSPPPLHGAEANLRYTFTDLTTAKSGDEFYKNHAVLLGLQKVVPFSRAHAAYFGASAQWSWADPVAAQRDEYVVFAGYHLQAMRQLDADVLYRYGRYGYSAGTGRWDNNHTLSATLRYTPCEWAALSLTSFIGFNRSNRREFDYAVWNGGLSLQLSVRF